MSVLHELPVIATVSVGLGVAFVAGFIATRLGLPALVGYLVGGIMVGPFTPGLEADAGIAAELAEIGVILLMFGIGTHFSIRDLLAVRKIALPGAVGQIAVATLMGAGAAVWWGWDLSGAIVFGLALSVASTVVLLRALQERGILDSVDGRIAVGWLVVEDLVMVLALILLPALSSFLGGVEGHAPGLGKTLAISIGITFLKIGAYAALMYGIGIRLLPWIFAELSRIGSRELITLFVAMLAISIAYGSATLFGVSFALGAFIAGIVVNEAGLSQRIAAQAEALEHVFAVLFFVSVGMLFNPAVLVEQPLRVLVVLAIIMIGKSLAAMAIVLAFRRPLKTALTVSASLAQIGEFSFILATLGISLGLMPEEGRDLILAGALLSITLNPVIFKANSWLDERRAKPIPTPQTPVAAPAADTEDPLSNHIVLIGYGHTGRAIGKALARAELPFVVIEQNSDIVEKLRKRGWRVIMGDATMKGVLMNAALNEAKLVVIATPNILEARRMHDTIKAVNPDLTVHVRADTDEETEYFRERGTDNVIAAERELARSMTDLALRHFGREAA